MLSYIHTSVSDFFCTSVLFVTVFSHTTVHCLFIFNFLPFISLAKTSKYVYIYFVYAFSLHHLFFLSPDMYEAVVLPYYAIKPYFL